jgi:predicted nuclease of predicted toxin-antitoxin system
MKLLLDENLSPRLVKSQNIELLLRSYSVIIDDFHADPNETVLVIP